MKADTRLFYEFGEFRLDTRRHRLLRGNEIITLTPRAFETLKLLVERPGIVIEREEFMDYVWRDATVEPGNLDVAIFKLRKALAENETGEKFIETIPRLGYKFIAPVREILEQAPAVVLEEHTTGRIVIDEEINLGRRTENGSAIYPINRSRTFALSATALTIVLATALFAYFWRGRATSASNAPTNIRSIAVLPFKSLTPSGESSHQGIGIADILITRLSNLRQITVRPTSAVMQFENQNENSISIARQLKVDAILEGSIYRAEDKVRLTGRLLRVSDQTVLWSGQFERVAGDEFQLQNEIALQVVDALALSLSGNEKSALTKNYTSDPDAYQLYLDGRYHWNKRNYEHLVEAQRLFRNAITKDPDFALAYVGLADSLIFFEDASEVLNALDKALRLDPNSSEAYATKGFLKMVHFWNWEQAELCFKKSISLNPNNLIAHHWYGVFLGTQGRFEEAKAEMRRALEINPLSYNLLADLGQLYFFDHDYAKAKEYCQKALEIYPEFAFAHQYLFRTYEMTGEYDRAVDQLEIWETALFGPPASKTADTKGLYRPRSANNGVAYREAFNRGGITTFWKFRLSLAKDQSVPISPNFEYSQALLLTLLGDKEAALENLERAFDRRPFLMTWLKVEPAFDSLRSEPRFQALLRKMNLPTSPQ
jgi:DNA-binding winged helix-turn-helix (wHTH) protein/TolB-like protein/Flp pilus assembly protein TadD